MMRYLDADAVDCVGSEVYIVEFYSCCNALLQLERWTFRFLLLHGCTQRTRLVLVWLLSMVFMAMVDIFLRSFWHRRDQLQCNKVKVKRGQYDSTSEF